jgi:hypothetical protein
MKVAIYNDTFLAARPHFGCELVMTTFKEQLDRVGIELVGTVSLNDRNPKHKILEKADLVIVNGEGSFHHNRRNDLAEVSKYFPSILINTVFEDNFVDLSKFRYISARETVSATNLKCDLIPDIILTSNILETLPEKRVIPGIGVGHIRHSGSSLLTLQSLDLFIAALCKYSSVTSESFHGILVSHILGIPCDQVLPGSGVEWKTFSVAKDIESTHNYLETGRNKINNLFENLHTFT